MAQRAALPAVTTTITPGYSWRLDLDVRFEDGRPTDWPDWVVRMHVWSEHVRFTLTNGQGVTFEVVDGLPGALSGTLVSAVIPIIAMTEAQTASLHDEKLINYLIDLRAPAGDAEDYLSGPISKVYGPPLGQADRGLLPPSLRRCGTARHGHADVGRDGGHLRADQRLVLPQSSKRSRQFSLASCEV